MFHIYVLNDILFETMKMLRKKSLTKMVKIHIKKNLVETAFCSYIFSIQNNYHTIKRDSLVKVYDAYSL